MEFQRRGVMLVIASPSGAGKSSISRSLFGADPNIRLSVSVTTRARRTDEVHGKHYYFIDVETFKGTVQLNGFVDTAASKEQAARIARNTKGVTAVRNNLTVRGDGGPSGSERIDDAAITAKVKAALAGDPRTKAHQVNVETREGAVQLSGFVDNSEAKSTAEELARNVDHVKSVDNEIDVKK